MYQRDPFELALDFEPCRHGLLFRRKRTNVHIFGTSIIAHCICCFPRSETSFANSSWRKMRRGIIGVCMRTSVDTNAAFTGHSLKASSISLLVLGSWFLMHARDARSLCFASVSIACIVRRRCECLSRFGGRCIMPFVHMAVQLLLMLALALFPTSSTTGNSTGSSRRSTTATIRRQSRGRRNQSSTSLAARALSARGYAAR